ncbi:MAG: hypothetical protein DBX44_03740 [Oscillospiraceae bacterium]|nr:MAG: hypothetical protein DBX44_03740 [Oscillospiraceae bacterium]
MKRTFMAIAMGFLLLTGCAAKPAVLQYEPLRAAQPAAGVPLDENGGTDGEAAFLIEPYRTQSPAEHLSWICAGKEFFALIRVTDLRGGPVEGLTCRSGESSAVTDASGCCVLPMRQGASQLLSVANCTVQGAVREETRYLVTARSGSEESELLLLWNGSLPEPVGLSV